MSPFGSSGLFPIEVTVFVSIAAAEVFGRPDLGRLVCKGI